MKEDDAVVFAHGSLVPDIGRYTPPEVAKSGWDSVRRNPMHAVDAYDYGILVFEVFNGGFSGADQIGSTKNIPLQIHNSYKRLTTATPKTRLSVAHFFEQGTRSGGFFDTALIQLTEGIENLGLKTDAERDEFLRSVLPGVKENVTNFLPANSKRSRKLMTFLKSFSRLKCYQSY